MKTYTGAAATRRTGCERDKQRTLAELRSDGAPRNPNVSPEVGVDVFAARTTATRRAHTTPTFKEAYRVRWRSQDWNCHAVHTVSDSNAGGFEIGSPG